MAKDKKTKIPKKVMGFKLSKGSRKDLRKLLGLLETPAMKALAISAGGALVEHFAEKAAKGEGAAGKIARKLTEPAKAH